MVEYVFQPEHLRYAAPALIECSTTPGSAARTRGTFTASPVARRLKASSTTSMASAHVEQPFDIGFLQVELRS